MIYQNYHRHSYYTNTRVPDATFSNEAYAIRAKELGHGIISTMEHGWQGRYIEGHELAEKYDLKFVFGVEAYWVKDRFKQDDTNCHIYIAAKNEKGRQDINEILGEANMSGFYYQPRLDLELLFQLNPNDVIVTTACVSFWRYYDIDSVVLEMFNHFKDSFYLEVQYHDTVKQKELNARILKLSKEHDIPIIMGCDSHYISSDHNWERDDYLKSKGIEYPDEQGWYLDYPDGNTAYQRFLIQGILSDEEIKTAMDNTNIFLKVEEYKNACFDKEIKMVEPYPGMTQEEKNKKLIDICSKAWEKEKKKIPVEKHKEYYEQIALELQTVIDTNFADYFLLDYELVKRGKELGGNITPSGRGSAVSFYINRLLGLTMVDRISAEVKMYPERFMSKTRIIESKGIPDIDLNLGNVSPFVQAQKQILGEEHVAPMLSYGTMQPKAAWKMYAKAKDVDFETANEVSKQIDTYMYALKKCNTDEEKEELNLNDYIDKKHHEIFEESKVYLGIISDWKIAPCGYLLYQGNIQREIGLVQIKDNLCCLMDGKWAEDYKFLKNDLLKVTVVDLIYSVYKKLKLEIHPVEELIKMCPAESKVWDVYRNGWTLGINQTEQTATRGRAMQYKPTNIAELCAFVAAVRPGFKSMYKTFEQRKSFEYGIHEIDKLIQTPLFPYSFMMYQETQMAVLNYAGIPLTECYDIIKNIAKKRPEKVFKYKEQFLKGVSDRILKTEGKTQDEADNLAKQLWQIIEDSASYSFNACFSGDTVIQRAGMKKCLYSPTLEEMFLIKNNERYARETNHIHLHKKYKFWGYGNALSMFDDGRIRRNKIIDIREAGIRETYKVKTKSGAWVICTMNHKFPTEQGEKKLFDIKVGDMLYVKGEYEKNTKKYGFTDGNFESNVPKKGQMGFQKREDGASVLFYAFRNSKVKKMCSCEKCNTKINDKFELHHIDGDRTNNISSNLMWICNSCHKKEHYNMNRVKMFEKGIPTFLDEVISIEFCKTEKVYDVEMAHPAHTVVSESGLVASNSHAYCTAVDSLYGAYLKTTYPKEFYSCFLQLLEESGEKNRMADVKQEAESAFGIYFPPMKFRQDNREIQAHPDKEQITNSLQSIKGFSRKTSHDLYSIKNMHFENFVEFLVYLEESGMFTSKIEDLIKIKYFDEFGGNKKLLQLYHAFTEGKTKYSKKHSAKTKQARKNALLYLNDTILDEELSLKEQIDLDMEVLGSIQATYDISKRYCYVMDLDLRYAPRAELYCLANGKKSSVKIAKRDYSKNEFGKGDIVFCIKFEERPTVKFVNGEYVPDGTMTWWLKNWAVAQELPDLNQ